MRKKGETHLDRDAAVTLVVQKYFPPGMKVEDAFNLLRQLKSKGFEIGEYRHEGARNWPDGEFKTFLDELHDETFSGNIRLERAILLRQSNTILRCSLSPSMSRSVLK